MRLSSISILSACIIALCHALHSASVPENELIQEQPNVVTDNVKLPIEARNRIGKGSVETLQDALALLEVHAQKSTNTAGAARTLRLLLQKYLSDGGADQVFVSSEPADQVIVDAKFNQVRQEWCCTGDMTCPGLSPTPQPVIEPQPPTQPPTPVVTPPTPPTPVVTPPTPPTPVVTPPTPPTPVVTPPTPPTPVVTPTPTTPTPTPSPVTEVESCFEHDKNYGGHDLTGGYAAVSGMSGQSCKSTGQITQSSSVTTLPACYELCRDTENCRFFTLFSGVACRLFTSCPDKGRYTTETQPAATYEMGPGAGAKTAAECQAKCAAHSECTHFSSRTITYTAGGRGQQVGCYLKKFGNSERIDKYDVVGVISGPKRCVTTRPITVTRPIVTPQPAPEPITEVETCFDNNKNYGGLGRDIPGGLGAGAKTAAECQAKCAAHSECTHFSFRTTKHTTEAMRCHLKKFGASETISKHDATGVISGPKQCPVKVITTQPAPVTRPIVTPRPAPVTQPPVTTRPAPVTRPIVTTQPAAESQPIVNPRPAPVTRPTPVTPIVDEPTPLPPVTHNCFTRESWSKEKKAWCCANKNRGCPITPVTQPPVTTRPAPVTRPIVTPRPAPVTQPPVTTRPAPVTRPTPVTPIVDEPTPLPPVAHNCFTRESWSEEKKAWCCANKNRGCPTR